MRHHMTAGTVQRLDLTPKVHVEAERMLLAQEAVPLRAADALHVALASTTHMAVVVTYDPRLAEAARSVGLHVEMPGLSDG